jgi:hypothetical protein
VTPICYASAPTPYKRRTLLIGSTVVGAAQAPTTRATSRTPEVPVTIERVLGIAILAILVVALLVILF